MKKWILAVFLGVAFVTVNAQGEPYQPEVEKAYERLRKVLEKAGVRDVQQNNYNLRAKRNTNVFMIHTMHKTGYISPKPVEADGPNYDGVLVEARVQQGERSGAVETPQVLHQTYWDTFVNSYPIDEGRSHIYLAISYGSRTDEKLIENIKQCFGPIVPPVSSDKTVKNRTISVE